jgi:hypothetical protein
MPIDLPGNLPNTMTLGVKQRDLLSFCEGKESGRERSEADIGHAATLPERECQEFCV